MTPTAGVRGRRRGGFGRAVWALVPDPTPRQAGEQIAESVAVHQAVVAHVSLENCWTEPP
jgi:hypothetical protein